MSCISIILTCAFAFFFFFFFNDTATTEIYTLSLHDALPITTETLAQRRNFLRMLDGQAVFKQAVTAMADACRQVLDKAGLSSDDVKMAIGHQANARILTALGKRL